MSNLEWQTGKVVEIIDETPNTRRLFIEVPSVQRFDFTPGQFVTLNLPISEKKNKRLRSYSISSAPDASNRFELIIVLVDDGSGSHYIFNNLTVGDEVVFRGPSGVFLLPEKMEQDLFMICTGTGIAPFRSMIQYVLKEGKPSKNIFLVFGTRTKSDLLYHTEMNELQQNYPQFHYIPVLSREDWDGKTGYVHAAYKEIAIHTPQAHFMICGWKKMVDEAKGQLLEMGFDKKQIHFELYG
ncbi:MAG: oxidoreductase [Bacteroidetes bacterium]|nr:oxidoreductase [Bacteroidota bacterium]